MRVRRSLALAGCALAWSIAAEAAGAGAGRVDFNREIRPILSENCYACHGPDQAQRKADLRLDTKDGLLGARDEAQIVVPGRPDESELYQRIIAHDPDE